jgi:hypothetical protein
LKTPNKRSGRVVAKKPIIIVVDLPDTLLASAISGLTIA